MERIVLADTHVHLIDEKLIDRKEEIAANLRRDGLAFIVEVGTGIEECLDVYEFSRTHEGVYCTLGVHPHYASEYMYGEYGERFEDWVREMVGRCESKIVAIGECGLDYYHNLSPVDVQKQVFIRQIKLARELGLPLVVHSRDAFSDTLAILRGNAQGLKILVHCFGYGAEELKQFGELDCYFAFGGAVTYEKADNLRAALKACPRDRLVLETDAPYLAPCEMRGKINEPRHIHKIAKFVAGELGLGLEDVAKITLENAGRFYGIAL